MNPLHYPSLELCKKLEEIGFPIVDTYRNSYWVYSRREEWFAQIPTDYTCPSVMEMLDEMPWVISTKWENFFLSVDKFWSCATYETLDRKTLLFCVWGIPNALAEMIIWLVENKHLTFK